MPVLKSEVLPIRNAGDIVSIRQKVRLEAAAVGMSLVDQTKLVTAVSEIARNVVDYANEGAATLEVFNDGDRRGVRIIFEDNGPGIPDVQLAMRDGFTTSQGLGLGLGGAKRLVNEFEINSEVGKGTRVVLTRWKL